ncbi:MAG: thermonuclease family protein [Erythrobacter sp.]
MTIIAPTFAAITAFTAVFVAPLTGAPNTRDGVDAQAPVVAASLGAVPTDRERATFPICSGAGRITCVVDGDTIWYRGEKIRLVGFDTPEVSRPECANEAALGERATRRLQDLLNAGAFSLAPNPDGRARDYFGRSLMVVQRGGANLGEVLISEGLAERRDGRRGGRVNVWC